MPSLLHQVIVEKILATARQNLAQDGYLVAALFVRFAQNTPLIVPVDLPNRPDQKWAYLRQLGRHLQGVHGALTEALLLSESWYVDGRTASAAGMLRPSQHPQRREAITVVGRNAVGDRYTCVVQPVTRDEHNHPVWAEIVLAEYDQPVTPDAHPEGVLDALFADTDKQAQTA